MLLRALALSTFTYLAVRALAGGDPFSGSTHSINGVRVTGPDGFHERTAAAMDALDPRWRGFVTANLTQIGWYEKGSSRSGNAFVTRDGVFHVNRATAFAYDSEGYAAESVQWYACGMVHEAQHIQQVKHSQLSFGKEREYEAILVQAQCLRDINAPERFVTYLEQLAGCIQGGGCRYWEGHGAG